MGIRFAAHFGTLDNIDWLAQQGFDEAGLVWPWDGSSTHGDIASAIHNAGISVATANLFNDGSGAADQLGAAGGQFAGYFQALVSAGWDCIAGEGCGGDVITTVENYCPYVNYGGIVGSSQADMYSSPWNHPTGGGKGHWDYIETYDNSNNYVDPSAAVQAAKNAGAKHLGILIMYGPNPAASADTYINLVNSLGLDTILFWGGYSGASSSCQSLASQLISALGVTKGGATAKSATTGGTTAAAAPAVPTFKPGITLALYGPNLTSIDAPVGGHAIITGASYIVETPPATATTSTAATQEVTPQVGVVTPAATPSTDTTTTPSYSPTPNLQRLVAVMTTPDTPAKSDAAAAASTMTPAEAEVAAKGATTTKPVITTVLGTFWPDKKGCFTLKVSSLKAEQRTYNVGLYPDAPTPSAGDTESGGHAGPYSLSRKAEKKLGVKLEVLQGKTDYDN